MSNFLTKALRSGLRSTIDAFPSLALFMRSIRDQLDRAQPALVTPWGFTLAGHAEMASGNFEPHETKLIRELLEDVDLFINVGANIGYYCCHALSLGKSVIAIEPINRNLHYLLKNIRDNGWSRRARVYPLAVGSDTDVMEMWGTGTGASLIRGWCGIPVHYSTLVPIHRLDDLLSSELYDKRALILVDVEGAEGMLLQGAIETISREPKPIWIMEITTTSNNQTQGYGGSFLSTFETFFCSGYTAYMVNSGMEQLQPEKVAEIAAGRCPVPTHNFLFK